jgi:hypothetical protein
MWIGSEQENELMRDRYQRDIRVGLGWVCWISEFGRLGSFLWGRSAKRPFMRPMHASTDRSRRFVREVTTAGQVYPQQ